MTFAEYMEQALYGPEGYYTSGRAQSGRKGDYFTSPDAGPTLGLLLALIFQDWKRALGFEPFDLVEVGAGEGALAQRIRHALPLPYRVIERSPVRRKKLEALGVTVVPRLEDLAAAPISGCIFGNELLDAFPVHRVRFEQGALLEGYVEDGRLVWGPPSTPRLETYLQRIGVNPEEGYETEINLVMAEWFQTAARALKRGLILLIDYGRPAYDYYAPERDRGTLRSFSRHHVGDNLLDKAGQIDLTADVDFTSAALDAREAGFVPLAFMEMGSFLIQGAKSMSNPPASLQYLIHPDGLGSQFHVLLLGKDVPFSPKDFPHNRLQRLGLRPLTPPSPARGEGVVTKGD